MKFKKSDITFYATITVKQVVVENVLCRAYLPLKLTDPIELHFHLTQEQLDILSRSFPWKFSIRGEVKNNEGKIQKLILANEVYFDRMERSTEFPFIGVPSDLTITSFIDNPNMNKVKGCFWVTSNSLLAPISGYEEFNTGKKKYEGFEFTPNDQLKLKFLNYEKSYTNEDDDTVLFYELGVDFELEAETNDSSKTHESLRILDDILLLTSFAARQRCVCVRWDSWDSKTSVTRFLRDRTLPDKSERKHNVYEELIEGHNFAEFIKTTLPIFQNYENIDAFRRTLNFITPRFNEIVENNFISLYSALEMIVLHFRKEKALELILDEENFEKFSNEIQTFIDKLDFSAYLENEIKDIDERKRIGKIKREQVKGNIKGLKRLSFGNAFRKFYKYYNVDLKDLWSVTGSNRGSLSDIRNKLVHGEHFSKKQYLAIITAREHLRWTIERMILSILGWSVEKSRVSSEYLKISSYQYIQLERRTSGIFN